MTQYVDSSVIEASLRRRGAVLVVAPTGSGKTYAVKTAAIRMLRDNTIRKAVFTLPTKALMWQVYRELVKDVGKERVGIDNSDAAIHPWFIPAAEWAKPIVVTSYEKLDNVLIRRPAMLKDTLLILDEAHNMISPDRATSLLDILALYKQVREQGWNTRIALLSATMPEVEQLAQYLNAEVIRHNVRPVELDVEYVSAKLPTMGDGVLNANVYWTGKLMEIVKSVVSAEKPVLVYVPSRRYAEMIARMIQRFTGLRAVAHHAGLPPAARKKIEREISKKNPDIDVVVATDTLAQGVNFAFRTVVVAGISRFVRGRRVLVPRATIRQVAGRAGRPQYAERGRVIFITYPDEYEHVIKAMRGEYDNIAEPSDYLALFVRLLYSGRSPSVWAKYAYKVNIEKMVRAGVALEKAGFVRAGRLTAMGQVAGKSYMSGVEMLYMNLLRNAVRDVSGEPSYDVAEAVALALSYASSGVVIDNNVEQVLSLADTPTSAIETTAFEKVAEALESPDTWEKTPGAAEMFGLLDRIPNPISPPRWYPRLLLRGDVYPVEPLLESLRRSASLVATFAEHGLLPRELTLANYTAAAAAAARLVAERVRGENLPADLAVVLADAPRLAAEKGISPSHLKHLLYTTVTSIPALGLPREQMRRLVETLLEDASASASSTEIEAGQQAA